MPFEGPGIKTCYTQIDRRLKTLEELKKIVMEELCENSAIHDIQITYRMSNKGSAHLNENFLNYRVETLTTLLVLVQTMKLQQSLKQ